MSETKKDEVPETVKINKWDGVAAKNALDDSIREVITRDLKCKESFRLIDTRLFICALAVGVAMYALLWDYLNPFPQSKVVLIVCVLTYFVLMGVLTLYTSYFEKGIFLVAHQKMGNVTRSWQASSHVKKYDDKYNLVLELSDSNGRCTKTEFTRSMANYIDTNGVVVQNLVVRDITKLFNSLTTEKKEK